MTSKSALTIMQFHKMVNIFHKDYPKKLAATSPPIDFILPIAKPTIKSLVETLKKKAEQPKVLTNKLKKFSSFGFL